MQKNFIHTSFYSHYYLKRFYEIIFAFHKIYLGTTNIVNIFICV